MKSSWTDGEQRIELKGTFNLARQKEFLAKVQHSLVYDSFFWTKEVMDIWYNGKFQLVFRWDYSGNPTSRDLIDIADMVHGNLWGPVIHMTAGFVGETTSETS